MNIYEVKLSFKRLFLPILAFKVSFLCPSHFVTVSFIDETFRAGLFFLSNTLDCCFCLKKIKKSTVMAATQPNPTLLLYLDNNNTIVSSLRRKPHPPLYPHSMSGKPDDPPPTTAITFPCVLQTDPSRRGYLMEKKKKTKFY